MPKHFFVSFFADVPCNHRHRTREGALKCARARQEAARKQTPELEIIAHTPPREYIKGKHARGKGC